jgi:hypothetical protein
MRCGSERVYCPSGDKTSNKYCSVRNRRELYSIAWNRVAYRTVLHGRAQEPYSGILCAALTVDSATSYYTVSHHTTSHHISCC